jgi:hypothetical protein
MTHDKIKEAARERMAETGEPYATARREVIKDHQEAGARPGATSPSSARWFAIDYTEMDRASLWLRTLLGRGSGRGSVEVGPDMLRLRTDDFHLDIPRSSARSVTRPEHGHRGTVGIHARRGSWFVHRSHDGLVELAIEPPCYLPSQLSTVFREMKVSSLIISLDDPDGFIAAVKDDGPGGD